MQYYRQYIKLSNGEEVAVWEIAPDTNGNPRHVVHYLSISHDYDTAIQIAKNFGGKRYTAQWFGGGIVFAVNDIEMTLNHILQHAAKAN